MKSVTGSRSLGSNRCICVACKLDHHGHIVGWSGCCVRCEVQRNMGRRDDDYLHLWGSVMEQSRQGQWEGEREDSGMDPPQALTVA